MTTEEVKQEQPAPAAEATPVADGANKVGFEIIRENSKFGIKVEPPPPTSDKKEGEAKKAPRNKNRRVNQIKKQEGGGGGANAAGDAPAAANGGENGGGGGQRQPRKRLDTWNARDLKIIRALSGILRHGMWGFEPDEQGFLFLEDILQHKNFKDQLGVKLDDLKRFGKFSKKFEIIQEKFRICNDKKGNKQFELANEEKDGSVL